MQPRLRHRLSTRGVAVAFASLAALLAPTSAAPAAGVRVGPRLWSSQVDATGSSYTEVVLSPYREVIIVVSGTFMISNTGHQDAHYRWSSSKSPSSPCETDAKYGARFSFTIDQRCRRPSVENFQDHTYVYYWTVGRSGRIRFHINDNKYEDNRGGLRVDVYAHP
jgi:hypothetical protein